MAQLNDLIVNGYTRFLNSAYGNLVGSATYTQTASVANNLNITGDWNSDSSRYIVFGDGVVNKFNCGKDTNLRYNPYTNVLSCPTFSGNLSGTASSAVYCYQEIWTANEERPVRFSYNSAGYSTLGYDSSFTFNPNSDRIKVPKISATNITATSITSNTATAYSGNFYSLNVGDRLNAFDGGQNAEYFGEANYTSAQGLNNWTNYSNVFYFFRETTANTSAYIDINKLKNPHNIEPNNEKATVFDFHYMNSNAYPNTRNAYRAFTFCGIDMLTSAFISVYSDNGGTKTHQCYTIELTAGNTFTMYLGCTGSNTRNNYYTYLTNLRVSLFTEIIQGGATRHRLYVVTY